MQKEAHQVRDLMPSTKDKYDPGQQTRTQARPRLGALTDLLKPIFKYWNGAAFYAVDTKKTSSLQTSDYIIRYISSQVMQLSAAVNFHALWYAQVQNVGENGFRYFCLTSIE